jgi:hypothetical protein
VYSIIGQKIFSEKIPVSGKVDCSSLSPGIYFVKIACEATIYRKGFIKINNP